MTCPKCGINVNDDSKFCENCGATLNEVQPIIQPEQQPEVQPIVQPEQQPEVQPIVQPEQQPEVQPIVQPEQQPEVQPIVQPEQQPEVQPIVQPEQQPEVQPIVQPEQQPEVQPIVQPEQQPEVQPIVQPEQQPEVQPIIQPEQQPMYQQPMYNQPQPMYQQPMYNQPQPMYQQPIKNKKSSNTVLIIIIVLLFIVAGVVIAIFLSKNDSQKTTNNNENEYENNNVKTTTTTTTRTTKKTDIQDSTGTIEYSGFKFKKLSGYTYEVDVDEEDGYENGLIITDKSNTLQIRMTALDNSLDDYIASEQEVKQEIESSGVIASNKKISTYKGIKMMTYEVATGNKKVLYFLAESGVDDEIFMGAIANKNYTIDYKNLDILGNIINNSTPSDDSFSANDNPKTAIDYNSINKVFN